MHARENHKSLARRSLHNCRSAIGKLRHHLAPSCELRPIFPIHVQRGAGRKGEFDYFLMNPLEFVSIELEWHPAGEIGSVVDGISSEECTGTDAQVVNPVLLHRAAQIGRRASAKSLPDLDGVSAGNDDQLVSRQLRLGHGIQLRRIGREMPDPQSVEHRLHRGDVCRSPRPIKKKYRLGRGYGRWQRRTCRVTLRSTTGEQDGRKKKCRQQHQSRPDREEEKPGMHERTSGSGSVYFTAPKARTRPACLPPRSFRATRRNPTRGAPCLADFCEMWGHEQSAMRMI